MKLTPSIFAFISLFTLALVLVQSYNTPIDEEYYGEFEEFEEFEAQNVYESDFFPAVSVASFTGPNIVGEFSFYQDVQGNVVATGAIQKGLKQDMKYQFRFYEGPSCDNLGDVLYQHEFESMHVLDMGGTPPIQESIPSGFHLTGRDGFTGLPWVLADEECDLACVILKGPQDK